MNSRTAVENTFTTHDGEQLFYRKWPSLSNKAKGAIVIFHRGHEHSGRLIKLVHELNLPNFEIFAWDARGHGQSPGKRGYSPGIATSLADVQSFVDHICESYGFTPEDIMIVGQSVGAVLAAGWVHDYAPNIRGMVLASPAFHIKLYMPFARTGLRLAQAIKGNFFVNSYVKAKYLTHDKERIASYENDPLIARPISVNMLLGIHDLSRRIIKDAAAINVPTQLLVSQKDWVVYCEPQHKFFEQLGSHTKERHVFKGFYHDTFGEKDRKLPIDRARAFIVNRFEEPVQRPNLLDADKYGSTRIEAEKLASPFPTVSLRRLYWGIVRLGLKFGGWFSKGIKIGHKAGFDSGAMLDYVYQNKPRGLTPVGRMIDRNYLNSIGWKGIRQRKIHIEELLDQTIKQVRDDGAPVHIADIAAGHGRYVLDSVKNIQQCPDSILLRDYSQANVEAGSRLIAQRGLSQTASFVQGDAFDCKSLASITPAPTIGIVSGLYELFADNSMIRDSLDGLARAIPDGGYLIYTCQPWHPQIELIARALTSHRQGQAWVMRRRTQAEMDQLVAAAGFTKITQRIDEWGIFSVCVARKDPS